MSMCQESPDHEPHCIPRSGGLEKGEFSRSHGKDNNETFPKTCYQRDVAHVCLALLWWQSYHQGDSQPGFGNPEENQRYLA